MCDLHVETWRQLVPPLSKLYLSLLCDRHCAGSGAQERSLLGKITLQRTRQITNKYKTTGGDKRWERSSMSNCNG